MSYHYPVCIICSSYGLDPSLNIMADGYSSRPIYLKPKMYVMCLYLDGEQNMSTQRSNLCYMDSVLVADSRPYVDLVLNVPNLSECWCWLSSSAFFSKILKCLTGVPMSECRVSYMGTQCHMRVHARFQPRYL